MRVGVRKERVGVRLLIVDTWWTKEDPFSAVFGGEVVRPTSTSLTLIMITAGGDTALVCLITFVLFMNQEQW